MPMEDILVNGVTEILKPLISLVSQQITLAWGVKYDLRKLKDTLESIQALIISAEEKQVNDAAVRLWLRRLKDIVYDVDDVMDEFSYETMRPRKHKVRALVSSSNPLLFKFNMARKIRAVNEKLEEIHKNSDRYMLRNISNVQDNHTTEQRNRLTSSVVDDSKLLGRDGAKSDIINILIGKSSPSTSSLGISSRPDNISTLSIVGMGGLGKTTVAQMVYKDDSILRNFELRAWVCVTDNFDIYKILRDTAESITRNKYENPSNVDVLANQVKEMLIGKKYLLVLDDLWNEDVGDWEKLKSYLIHGGMGSKILVTTRSQKVASVVGGKSHDLEKLTDDICWSIIEEKILCRGGAVLTKKMKNIGIEIARKCDGLPLAANSLGSLMCSRKDESYWLSILNNINHLRETPEHTRIMSILKLSFDNLSSPLKRCFSYCCIFPKDWEINREMLIRLWMAEGFLFQASGEDDLSFEDTGNQYFEYLVWSSFFQDVQKDEEMGNIRTCKMHDLVHDLAMSVQDPNEFGIAKVEDGKEEISQVRRLKLLFDGGPRLASPNVLLNAMKLRTLIAVEPYNFSHINSLFRLKRLRILCLLGGVWRACSLSRGFEFHLTVRKVCFASSISNLKHLRYLDLSYIDLFGAASINHSYNLQTLVLHGCRHVPSWFLSEIGNFKCLWHLDISYSDIKYIPENIGSLEHLGFLDLSYTPISRLPDSITCISSLRTLKFDYCWNLDSLPTELGALTQLRRLDLEGTGIEVLPESCIKNLCNLEIVELRSYCKLPREINNWPKLRILTHSRDADVMPRGIESLTCLKTLEDYMVRKENETGESSNNSCGSGVEEMAGLNSLEVLGIRNLENVRGAKEGAERANLKDKQHLVRLGLYWGSTDDDSRSVKDCKVLDGLQPHSNLRSLYIYGFSGVNLPNWMLGCSLSNCLPNLVTLTLTDCSNCEKLPALGMLPFLQYLKIAKMKSVKCLGEEFYHQQQQEEKDSRSITTKRSPSLFPSLAELDINLENLEEWVAPPISSSFFPFLERVHIFYHQRLRSTPIMLFSSLKELILLGTSEDAINSLLSSGGDGCATSSLASISIWYSPDLIYLPPLGVLLRHNTLLLREVEIAQCANFQGFRDDADDINSNISSFHSLCLRDCPVLTSIPDLRLLTSLRKLEIRSCDNLKKESIPYDLNKSLTFLEELYVDFTDEEQVDPSCCASWLY